METPIPATPKRIPCTVLPGRKQERPLDSTVDTTHSWWHLISHTWGWLTVAPQLPQNKGWQSIAYTHKDVAAGVGRQCSVFPKELIHQDKSRWPLPASSTQGGRHLPESSGWEGACPSCPWWREDILLLPSALCVCSLPSGLALLPTGSPFLWSPQLPSFLIPVSLCPVYTLE